MAHTHRFKIAKLIRDKLPQIMRSWGIEVSERVMEKDEYVRRLKEKLLEEAQEVMASTSVKELEEEVADVLEVMHALLKAYGIEFSRISHVAQEKRESKGGFDNRVYADYAEMDAHNPRLAYYRAQPDKYPEIP